MLLTPTFDGMKKFAIVGCGRIAKRHAEILVKAGNVAAVCDIRKERADAFAEAFGAKAYGNVDHLLKEQTALDLVVICTPNGLHAEHIIKSLQAGYDVLAEKPLCLTKAAAWQIVETEKYCRRRLLMVQSVRYNPLLQGLKKQLDKNAFGKIYCFHLSCVWNRPPEYFTDWHGKLFPDGGLLYNQFSHYLDALLMFFGEIEEAKGFTANLAHQTSVEFEDSGVVALQMKSGALGSLQWTVNAFQKNFEIALTIVAEKATLRIGGDYLNKVEAVQSGEPLSLKSFEKGSVNFHEAMYAELLCSSNETPPDFPGVFEGLKTVETIEKIYKAVR